MYTAFEVKIDRGYNSNHRVEKTQFRRRQAKTQLKELLEKSVLKWLALRALIDKEKELQRARASSWREKIQQLHKKTNTNSRCRDPM